MRTFAAACCFVTLLAGCGGAAPTGPAPKAAPNQAQADRSNEPLKTGEKKPAEPWGTLKGRIIWGSDDIPERGFVTVPAGHQDEAFCLKAGKIPEDNTTVVDPKTKGLRDVFIWLVARDKLPFHPSLAEAKATKVIIDQPVCSFIPHALALREGQILIVKNTTAATAHNFKYDADPEMNASDNKTIAPAGQLVIDNLKAQRRPILTSCGFHPWMRGWIMVFDHPYFAVTDAQGNFEIKLAPAGSYQLMIQHGQAGYPGGAKGRNGRTIEIAPGGTDLGAIEFPPPPK